MGFTSFRKLQCGFPLGAGDEYETHAGGEFIIAPSCDMWRVIIIYANHLIHTRRIKHLAAARSYGREYLERKYAP